MKFTVSRNEVVAFVNPSVTASVMVAVPDLFAAGVTVTERFDPLPLKTMLPGGTNEALEEIPFTVNESAVSASPTVKAIGPVALFSFTV